VTLPHLPSLPFLEVDPADTETLGALMRGADVFLQAYRPHGLAARGFGGPEDCAALRPGIVHASLTGFSPSGPWQDVKSVGFSLSHRSRLQSERRWTAVV
jgi:crotonobetainyl-CoA:carnitine CoA-transferase CaiB-like acyl-CoA transferase